MWRAYGGAAGVAIVMNTGVFLRPSSALTAYTSPVAYFSPERFKEEFTTLTNNIEREANYLREKGDKFLFNHIFNVFKLAMVCTKHPGFEEEREWRIVYEPSFRRSERIEQDTVVIGGVPQIVHNIPFKNYPDEGFEGAELPELIDRIIIGPTEFPDQLRQAIIILLEREGIHDAADKVVCSTIPLR